MQDQGLSTADILVLVGEGASELSLNYFFSVVFGYRTQFVQSPEEARDLVNTSARPALFVVCTEKMTDDLVALIAQISAPKDKPFILSLADDAEPNLAIRLFEAGADEVLPLPISLKELAYRLRSRASGIGLEFHFDPDQAKTLDIAADIVRRADLTEVEAQVVLVLMEQGGGIVSRDELSLAIDKKPWSYGNRKFDVHVASIRKKLDSAYGGDLTVRTVRTAGYQLALAP